MYGLNRKLKSLQKKRLKALKLFQKMIDKLIKMNEKLITMENQAAEEVDKAFASYKAKQEELDAIAAEAKVQRESNLKQIDKLKNFVE